ncbi:MAG TPA: hypothetical protein VGI85_15800 [Chthoniobacterales bacterium]|jgi:hypothetical protein
MVISIVKAIIGWVVLAFIGTNLIGFVVRGLLWTRRPMDTPTDRVAELLARESRRMSIANVAMTILAFVCVAAYLIAIHYFLGVGVLLAACAIMASRLPDLLWEIGSGPQVTRSNAPKDAGYTVGNILFWGALPLLWYSLCTQSS